jgi:predicted kinase
MPRQYQNDLILLRGIPGSGKTEFAKSLLVSSGPRPTVLVEADQYFEAETTDSVNGHKPKGVYRFDPNELHLAHEWCQSKTLQYLMRGDNVVVANTFSRQWEMQPYIDMAKEEGHRIFVLTVHGEHGSVHGVPDSTIQNMKKRWENDPIL